MKYLFDLSNIFNDFYNNCKCIEYVNKEIININYDRLKLCKTTALIMKQCFEILGLLYVDVM